MKAIEQYFHFAVCFRQFCKMKFKNFSLVLHLALLGVKGLNDFKLKKWMFSIMNNNFKKFSLIIHVLSSFALNGAKKTAPTEIKLLKSQEQLEAS